VAALTVSRRPIVPVEPFSVQVQPHGLIATPGWRKQARVFRASPPGNQSLALLCSRQI
jgi:hypothetical protein